MNNLSRLEMANLILNTDQLKNLLCKTYGVKDVSFKDLSYGIGIDISGVDSFLFIKNAIVKTLDVSDDTIAVLSESNRKKFASYVYLPEKDRKLHKRLKK
jgi:hypothetical protein